MELAPFDGAPQIGDLGAQVVEFSDTLTNDADSFVHLVLQPGETRYPWPASSFIHEATAGHQQKLCHLVRVNARERYLAC